MKNFTFFPTLVPADLPSLQSESSDDEFFVPDIKDEDVKTESVDVKTEGLDFKTEKMEAPDVKTENLNDGLPALVQQSDIDVDNYGTRNLRKRAPKRKRAQHADEDDADDVTSESGLGTTETETDDQDMSEDEEEGDRLGVIPEEDEDSAGMSDDDSDYEE